MAGDIFLKSLERALAALSRRPPEVAANPKLLELVARLSRPNLALAWAENLAGAKLRRDTLYSLGLALLPDNRPVAREALLRALLAAASVTGEEERFPSLALQRMARELAQRGEFWPLAMALPQLNEAETAAALMEGTVEGLASEGDSFPLEALPRRPWNSRAFPSTAETAGAELPPDAEAERSITVFFAHFWNSWRRLSLSEEQQLRLSLFIAEGMRSPSRFHVLRDWLNEVVDPLIRRLTQSDSVHRHFSTYALLLARVGEVEKALDLIASGQTYPWALPEVVGYVAFYQDVKKARRSLYALAQEGWVVPYGLVNMAYAKASAGLNKDYRYWSESHQLTLSSPPTGQRRRAVWRLLYEAWECARRLGSSYDGVEATHRTLVAMFRLGFTEEAFQLARQVTAEDGWALPNIGRALITRLCYSKDRPTQHRRALAKLGELSPALWREGLHQWLGFWLAGHPDDCQGICSPKQRQRCWQDLREEISRVGPGEKELYHQAALFWADSGEIERALDLCHSRTDEVPPSEEILKSVIGKWVEKFPQEAPAELWERLVAAAPPAWKEASGTELSRKTGPILKRAFFHALLDAGRVQEALDFWPLDTAQPDAVLSPYFSELLEAALAAAKCGEENLARRLAANLFLLPGDSGSALTLASGSAWAVAALGALYPHLYRNPQEQELCRAAYLRLLSHSLLTDRVSEACRWFVRALAWTQQDVGGGVQSVRQSAGEMLRLFEIARSCPDEGVGNWNDPLLWAEFAEGFASLGETKAAREALENLHGATCWETLEVKARTAFSFPPLSPQGEKIFAKMGFSGAENLRIEAEKLVREVLEGWGGAYNPGSYYALFRGAIAPWVRQEYCWRAVGALRQDEPERTALLIRLWEEGLKLDCALYRFEALHTVASIAAFSDGGYVYKPRYRAMFASEFWGSFTYGTIFHPNDLPENPPKMGLLAAAAGKMLVDGAMAGPEEFWLRLTAFSPLLSKLNIVEEVWKRIKAFLANPVTSENLGRQT